MGFRYPITLTASIIGIMIIVIFSIYGYKTETIEVIDFESCIDAGNPAMESYPRQCMYGDKTYVEDISSNIDPAIFDYFTEEIIERGIENFGAHPIEGFNPELFKMAFPGLVDSDFDGTDAISGMWKFDGELKWISDGSNLVTSGDGTLTNKGLGTLLDKLSKRLNIVVESREDIDNIISKIEGDDKVFCNDEDRKGDFCITLYDPVCGWGDPDKIQCITYPCASTYSNSCFACLDENVLYWTKGECSK